MQALTPESSSPPLSYASPQTPRAKLAAPRWLTAALLVGIVTVALAARLYQSDRLALHYDEAWTQERATGRGSEQGRFIAGLIYRDVPRLTSLRVRHQHQHCSAHPTDRSL